MTRIFTAYLQTLGIGAILLISLQSALGDVSLPAIFGDQMILQRNIPIPVWGRANPGEQVKVTLAGVSQSTKTDKQGKWLVKLPAMKAGGPFTLAVEGEDKAQFHDVLIGDVWLCGGQSNMQWQVRQTNYDEKDTAFIDNAQIRLFSVYVETDYTPRRNLKGSGWKKLNKEAIDHFSAVAYHFGKYIHEKQRVPVGLISDNLGATSVETWMSYHALMEFPQFESEVKPFMELGKSFAEITADFEKYKAQWYKKHYYKGEGIENKWYVPETDISDWKSMQASGNTWENTDLEEHDGAVWFRKTFDLPEGISGDSLHIALSQIDDYDIVWVNGQKIGETYGRHNHRNYYASSTILKPRDNVIVVRVFDTGGIGGFTTSSFWGNPILWGDWKYKKGLAIDPEKFSKPVVVNVTPFSTPGALFNGSIAPLIPYAIKGVVWYQGESNAERACEYRELFPALIRDWRKQWGQGDFPFLFVQLANYQPEALQPGESDWAELREAQSLALQEPNTGMAAAIDVGEADDIHPKDKKTVGERLGIAALKAAYNEDLVHSGPAFREWRIEGKKAVIHFDYVDGGLVAKDKYGYVRGFQIAGEDKQFYWGKAYIRNNSVFVYSDHVEFPSAVRYAWADNPGPLDLYNAEGLPAVPFRTDDWEGATCGKKFAASQPRF